MKPLLVAFTFLLVFTVSLTPAAMGVPDYPPTPSDSEDVNDSKNPVDELKSKTKDENYYGKGGYNQRTPYKNFKGGFDGTAEAESIKMWFCGNNPFGSTSQGAGSYSYSFDGRNSFNATAPGLIDQNELRQSVIQKCMKSEKYMDWHTTDTVYVVIYAPGFNEDPFKVDYIGNKQYNEIFCTSDASPTVGMWRNEGGREGASWGYQSWLGDNGWNHRGLWLPAVIGGPNSYLGNANPNDDWKANKEHWASSGFPGFNQWWSNQGNNGLQAVKGIKEIGVNTGVFSGTVTLSGVQRFLALPEKMSYGVTNGEYNKQFTSGSDRSNQYDVVGSKICSMQTDRTGAFTITWEYSEDKFVSKTAYYTMREGEVKFGDDIVTMDQQVSVILSDRDVSSRPWDSGPVQVRVWSDSDQGGISLDLRHERDWWVMQADDQTFYGTLFLSSDQESLDMDAGGKGGIRCYQGECYERGSARLHAQPGDHIYVQYKDYTLPKPYSLDGCQMVGDYSVDSEPFTCEHIDIYNYAKVSDATPISKIALKKISILPYEKPDYNELNKINDDINTQKRLIVLEESRLREDGINPTHENLDKYSFKYEGLLQTINTLEENASELKYKIKQYSQPASSRTFLEGETVYIIGEFQSSTYAQNQFIFAAQAEHIESGEIEYIGMSPKQTITKKTLKEVGLEWIPKQSGEYTLKIYALDSRTMGAVLKDPVINHIHIESIATNLSLEFNPTEN
tara:strand:+ start:708 stop:2906 length:2199 start_codon:yes stop_codon:yes gene_type:complete